MAWAWQQATGGSNQSGAGKEQKGKKTEPGRELSPTRTKDVRHKDECLLPIPSDIDIEVCNLGLCASLDGEGERVAGLEAIGATHFLGEGGGERRGRRRRRRRGKLNAKGIAVGVCDELQSMR
jgi:hypothetical protein